MALTPGEIEWLKEAQKQISLDERAEADVNSMRAYRGREEELQNFEITQEQVDMMWNEFGISWIINWNRPISL